jgi:hypothetical protein
VPMKGPVSGSEARRQQSGRGFSGELEIDPPVCAFEGVVRWDGHECVVDGLD